MATFIPGITDYIPQIQPFKPDYNFLSGILQTKQSRYDAARKQISETYGALLNAPLTKDENVKRRDDFFKMVDNDIQRISGLDLSLAQNKDAALNIFKPLYEDKYLAKDMAWTKNLQNKAGYAERLKYCADPEKCGGVSYSSEGVEYLGYQRERFKNSSMDDSLNFDNPTYAGDPGLQAKALKFAKDMGYDLKTVSWSNGGFYKIERTNDLTGTVGQTFLESMTQAFMGIFGNDGKVTDFYNQKASLNRERTIRTIAPNFNNDLNAAEDYYNQEMIKLVGPNIKNLKQGSDKLLSDSQNVIKVVEQKVKKNGRVPGDVIDNVYVDAQGNLKIAEANSKVVDGVYNDYVNTSNTTSDRKFLSKTVDRLYSNNLLNIDFHNIATQYANLNYEEKYDVDQYRLAMYNDQLARGRMQIDFNNSLLKSEFDSKLRLKEIQKKFELDNGITEDDKKFIPVAPDPGASTKTNTLKDVQTLIKDSFNKTNSTGDIIAKSFVNEMVSVINSNNSSPEEIKNAKSQLKAVFNTSYDEKDNKFLKSDGTPIDVTLDNIKQTKAFENSVNVINSIKSLVNTNDYKALYEDFTLKISPAIKDYDDETKLRSELNKAHQENTGKIKSVLSTRMKLSKEDKDLLENVYFKPESNGYNRLEFNNFKNLAKDKYNFKSDNELKELYDVFQKNFFDVYMSGQATEGGKPVFLKNPVYSTKGTNQSGFALAQNVDAKKFVVGTGAYNTVQVLKDVLYNPQAKFYSNITDITGKEITGQGADKIEPSKEAKSDAQNLYNDLVDPKSKTSESRPRGTFLYKGIIGNDPNLEGYVFVPDNDYTTKVYDGTGKTKEKSMVPILITIPKNATNNSFSRGIRNDRAQLLLNLGPIELNQYPLAGNLKIERDENQSIYLSGRIIDYNTGKPRTVTVNDNITNFNQETLNRIEGILSKFQEANVRNISLLNQDKLVYNLNDLSNAQAR
jgi:hypothetical protein